MASIRFVIVRIWRNQFKCNYLKSYRLFFNILLNFWNLHQILNIREKKMTLVVSVFWKFQPLKGMIRQMFK